MCEDCQDNAESVGESHGVDAGGSEPADKSQRRSAIAKRKAGERRNRGAQQYTQNNLHLFAHQSTKWTVEEEFGSTAGRSESPTPCRAKPCFVVS